jgi:predicted dehydrogenase
MKKIGVGVIGTGNIALTGHGPAITAINSGELVAVLSRSVQSANKYLASFGTNESTAHTLLKEFVTDSRIDLAIICSPDGLHYEQAAACLKVGKNVLLEKPMTLEVVQAEELIALAEANKVSLTIGFHLRSHVGHRMLHKQVVENKEIGNIRHIRIIWAFPVHDDTNWRTQEDLTKWWSLSAVGSHCIDLARWFANDDKDWQKFSTITTNNLWHGKHDETAIIAAQTVSGITVEIVSSVQFGPYNMIEIFGDDGMARCEGTMGREGAGSITINGNPLIYSPLNPFITQLEEVIGSIQTGSATSPNGKVGLRSVKDLLLTTRPSELIT